MPLPHLLSEFFTRFAEMTILTLVFGITGYIFLFLLFVFDNKAMPKLPESIGMALSTGLVLVILLVIGLGLLGIPVTKTSLSIPFLGIYLVSALRLYKKKSTLRACLSNLTQRKLFESLIPIFIFFIALSLRAIQIRGVFVPSWFDGLIHTTLLNKFLVNAKIPIDNIYHDGFHAIALVVHYFLGSSLPETILILGQWLGAVSGLTFYYLSLRYIRNTYVAGLSFVAYSLFLMFPSYLTSLGRYPFLLGLTLLPFTIITSLNWVTNHKSNYMLAVLFIAALGLTHYGTLLIWSAFVFSYMVNRLAIETCGRVNLFRYRNEILVRPALLILPLLFIILPKTINLINHPFILTNMIARVQEPNFNLDTQALLEEFYSKNYFFFFLWIIWLPWVTFVRRKWFYITLLWPLAVWSFTLTQYQIVGFSISTYVNLIIFLSMPLALTFGFISRELILCLHYANSFFSLQLSRHFLKGFPPVLLIIGLLLGIFSFPRSIDEEKALLTKEDMVAMYWIKNNTPENSVFLVRTVIWSNMTLIPYDGGGWINFITKRQIIIPQVGELYDLCEFAKRNRVDYIYYGKKQHKETFDLRLDELTKGSYVVVYKNQSVVIISLSCP